MLDPHRCQLQRIARRVMLERGLLPDFSPAVIAELATIDGPARDSDGNIRDLRTLLWCSVDNDDSRDLDQLSAAEALPGGGVRIYVAIADVDALVPRGSAIDAHAGANTTSVYTPAQIFSMLPEKLSTDLSSLNDGEDRLAHVAEMEFDADGTLDRGTIYRALVHNHAKLAYNAVAAWLEDAASMPAALAGVPGLDHSLRLQDGVAQQLKRRREQLGALGLETIEARAVFAGETVSELRAERRNRAKDLIENFMVAANGVSARFLEARRMPSLRRVVRSPERWPRIVDLAAEYDEKLPEEPDPRALALFLERRREADPKRFPDLSLSVVKLLGKGEYVVEMPGQEPIGHFGLAVRDYTHSTAPNRRYPDLITQRLLKAALAGASSPYDRPQLETLARHCTAMEDAAAKVERQMRKSTAACLLQGRIGDEFEGLVTGASPAGTWVRVFEPPVEGRMEAGAGGLDVGDEVRVRLVHTDVERGFIDFHGVGARPRGRRRR